MDGRDNRGEERRVWGILFRLGEYMFYILGLLTVILFVCQSIARYDTHIRKANEATKTSLVSISFTRPGRRNFFVA